MFRKILKINIVFLFLAILSNAEVIKDIKVEGNKRISSDTIKVLGSVTVNDVISSSNLNEILKNLYETNFFSDVSLNFSNNVLKITVKENPIIQTIEISGIKNKGLLEQISDSLKLREKTSFVESIFKEDLKLVKNSLKISGYYFVEVDTSLIKNDNNTIDLVYNFDLGEKAHIGKISFIGNKIYKDRKLRNIIVSEESRFWKFISSKKFLNQSNIKFDKKLLKNYYRDNGYYKAKIIDGYAKYLDTNQFEVIYNIEAGKKYYFNNFNLDLPADFNKENFNDILDLFTNLKGEKYSYTQIEKILDEIDKISERDQYEFIDADITETIVQSNKIDFLIKVGETEKVYVEKINIFGNNITEESFIRNQLIVDEGDAFNKILQTRSMNRLRSKNIFESVNYSVKDGSSDNKKIVEINVVEKPTGEIFAGAGVGTSGASLSLGISENNYLGTGTKLDTSFTVGEDTFTGLLKITKPNYKYSDNSLNTTIESTKVDKLTKFGYDTRKNGFEIGTSYEQFKNFYFSPSISNYHEKIDTNNKASTNLQKQEGTYLTSNFLYSLVYDLRNRSYQPTAGQYMSFSQELPLYTSDDYSIVNGFNVTKYFEPKEDMIGALSLYLKSVNSINNKDVRISNRLNLPERRLRGFESGKIGPTDEGNYVGGNYAMAINYSSTIPQILPSMQNADFKFFVDIGNVWGIDYSSTLNDSNKIRSSIGFSADWYTPIGPLTFSFANPISKANTDKTETFRFNIGTSF